MSKRQDLTGQIFGRWTAQEYAGNRKWSCLCECGVRRDVYTQNLQRGNSKSCGCYDSEQLRERADDLTGQPFGSLIALSRDPSTKYDRPRWICRCTCGKTKSIAAGNLRAGKSQSCGCQKSGWHQYRRMSPQASRSLYICAHPELEEYYKIGLAVNPRYRESACNGGLRLLHYVTGTNEQVVQAEKRILGRSREHWQVPPDQQGKPGYTEWRSGPEVLDIWHEEAQRVEGLGEAA